MLQLLLNGHTAVCNFANHIDGTPTQWPSTSISVKFFGTWHAEALVSAWNEGDSVVTRRDETHLAAVSSDSCWFVAIFRAWNTVVGVSAESAKFL